MSQGKLANIPPKFTAAAWDLVEELTFDRTGPDAPRRATVVSREIGVSVTALHAWEHGEYMPSLSAFVAWADALGYTVALVPKGE